MKRILLSALLAFFGLAAQAQVSTAGNILGAAGGTASTASFGADWTVGGTAVTSTARLPNGQFLTQGFLQAQYTIVQLLLSFDNLPGKTYGDVEFELHGSASDGTELVYTSADPSIAKIVNGNIVQIVGAGTTYITATIKNTTISKQQTLVVDKATQTITFDFIPVLQKGGAAIAMNATSSAGLPVTFEGKNGFVVRVAGNMLSPIDIGKATVEAAQAGNKNYKSALVSQTVTVEDVNGTQLIVPMVLTPNGDNINDVLVIRGIENFPNNSLLIVNRNGTKVFYAKNYNNSEVIFNGSGDSNHEFVGRVRTVSLLPQGTYFYILEYQDGQKKQKKTGYFIIKY